MQIRRKRSGVGSMDDEQGAERHEKGRDKLQDFGKALNDGREDIVKRFVCSWVRAVLDDYKVSDPEGVGCPIKYNANFGYAKKMYENRNGEMPIRDFKALSEYRHNFEA